MIDYELIRKSVSSSLAVHLEHSVQLLIKAESLALKLDSRGYHLAFSGGKDSQALYHVAELAGVKFHAHFNITSIDPPAQVRFVKKYYPDVVFEKPRENMWHLCERRKMLPTRAKRFCCKEFKERSGAGSCVLTGVRHAESIRRRGRGEFEIQSRRKSGGFKGTMAQFDEFTYENEIEDVQCIKGQDKLIINPIIEWSDNDVWNFLNKVACVPHCELYDKGWKRIGCLFCPMATVKERRVMELEYPRYKALFLRCIHRMRSHERFLRFDGLSDEDVFRWWLSDKPVAEWIADSAHPELDFQ